MKHLLLIIAVLFAACTKPTITSTNQLLYYRIKQVDKDGTITYSPIRKIDITLSSDKCNGEDEDDDDDHHTLAIDFETFTVTKTKTNDIKINWQASNEENVSQYVIERSIDSKNWISVILILPNSTGIYTFIDRPSI